MTTYVNKNKKSRLRKQSSGARNASPRIDRSRDLFLGTLDRSRDRPLSRPRLRIVITAGPTREYLDTVRFISNPSSGKMGYAIARAAAMRGHAVTLVSGPVALRPPKGLTTIHVETGQEMAAAAKRAFLSADAAILCAAVCDYRPVKRSDRKLPKSRDGLTLRLETTEDIAAALGRIKGRRVTIGFALEDRDARAHALEKMRRKRFDAIVLNGPGNIGSDLAEAALLTADGTAEWWPAESKARMAGRIVRCLERLDRSGR